MHQMSRAALKLTTLLLYGIQLPAVPKEGPSRATLTVPHNSLNESRHFLERGNFLWWCTLPQHLPTHLSESSNLISTALFSVKESAKCEWDSLPPGYPLWVGGALMVGLYSLTTDLKTYVPTVIYVFHSTVVLMDGLMHSWAFGYVLQLQQARPLLAYI